MKRALWIGLIIVFAVLSACSSNEPATTATASEEEVQASVLDYYNEMSKIEQLGKSSLEAFNTTLTSYSTGDVTDKQLEKAIDKFQSTAADISDQAEEVKIPTSLPAKIRDLLQESLIAFNSAYSLKKEASEGADSDDVSAEEFNDLNQKADLAMLYGISKLNEAREAAGLMKPEDETQKVEK
ncbi:hypothetical protein [Paenibacillus monticola]|uniref:Inhibitor of growth protein N-terminal histone-binding domain-containing protein n=1 Tax=Paenibacillus monticola TaxID=2666075 RepID=A0A7X2H8U8_9BACL|nr:hypothetical protein [Paenibacillus monticola]MRN55603.1 hypothetical protein [Paenibacillus monticola]